MSKYSLAKKSSKKDEDEGAGLGWLALVRQQQERHNKKKEAEKKARAARLARLFDDDLLESDDDLLDANAAGAKVDHVINKIDTHLKVEKQLLEAWQEVDKEARDETAKIIREGQK